MATPEEDAIFLQVPAFIDEPARLVGGLACVRRDAAPPVFRGSETHDSYGAGESTAVRAACRTLFGEPGMKGRSNSK